MQNLINDTAKCARDRNAKTVTQFHLYVVSLSAQSLLDQPEDRLCSERVLSAVLSHSTPLPLDTQERVH